MSFFRRFVSIFVSPNEVFDEIRESMVGWWQPWLMVSVLIVIATWLMVPVQAALMEANPEMAGEAGAEAITKVVMIVQVALAPIMVLIVTLILAAISYVVVTLVSKEATFKKYFTLILFADVVASVGFLASMIILRSRGLDQITSPEDMKVGLSLRPLLPEAGPVLSGLLGSLEFFAVWGFVLIVIGLRRIFGMSLGSAIAASVPLWLLYTAFSIVGEMFNQGP